MSISQDAMSIELIDGRTLQIPLEWYPRLMAGTISEREDFRFLGQGEIVHWPRLDEDISVSDLLAGNTSQESLRSFQKWKDMRSQS